MQQSKIGCGVSGEIGRKAAKVREFPGSIRLSEKPGSSKLGSNRQTHLATVKKRLFEQNDFFVTLPVLKIQHLAGVPGIEINKPITVFLEYGLAGNGLIDQGPGNEFGLLTGGVHY